MDVYDRIDIELKKRGWSRRQLAIAAGIQETTLASAFKRRSKFFPADRLQKIALTLGVPINQLLPYEEFRESQIPNDGDEFDLANLLAVMDIEVSYKNAADYRVKDLLAGFAGLNAQGRDKVIAYIDDLLSSPRYVRRDISQRVHNTTQGGSNHDS